LSFQTKQLPMKPAPPVTRKKDGLEALDGLDGLEALEDPDGLEDWKIGGLATTDGLEDLDGLDGLEALDGLGIFNFSPSLLIY